MRKILDIKNWKIWKNWKKIGLIVLIVLLSLILTVALVAAIGGTYIFNKLGSAMPNETVSVIPPDMEDFETDPPESTTQGTTESTQATETTASTQPTETDPPPETRPNFVWPEVEQLYSEDVINILLVGKDATSAGSRPRTDSMILLSINKKTKSLSMVSLMRDLYVQIPGGYSDNRINAAYRFGGISLLNDTIEKNFGIQINGNVEVDFRQFEKIIDILGGVDINLTAAEARHLTSLKIYGTVSSGMNHLNGRLALAYCRIRQIDSDHKRTERQRNLLQTVAASVKNMSVSQMIELINQVLPYIQTDLSTSEIIELATAGLGSLASGKGIKSGKIPQSGQYYGATIMGMQVMVPHLYPCNQYLKEFIYG